MLLLLQGFIWFICILLNVSHTVQNGLSSTSINKATTNFTYYHLFEHVIHFLSFLHPLELWSDRTFLSPPIQVNIALIDLLIIVHR